MGGDAWGWNYSLLEVLANIFQVYYTDLQVY